LKDLIVIGAGGHARVVIDTALSCGYQNISIIDLNFNGQWEEILGIQVSGNMDVLDSLNSKNLFLAIGDNSKRKELYTKLQNQTFQFPSLIHPKSFVSDYSKIMDGTLVMNGAQINAASTIGKCSIINTSATIDHECTLGDFTHIGPGANIAGRAEIGDMSFIGIGSSVIQNISIGRNVIIGANSTVIENIGDNQKYVGVNKFI
jgi:sugar O-acyltransferase (sialic acid O-acetyltransferase NeuD family)